MAKESQMKIFCENKPEPVLSQLLNARSRPLTQWKQYQFIYPQNMLRNVGREGCQTEHTIVPGVKIIL